MNTCGAATHDPPHWTAAQVAERLGATLVGDGGVRLARVRTLDEADEESLSWLGDPQLLPKLESTRARVVIVPQGCSAPSRITRLAVRDPDLALCDALRLFAPRAEPLPAGVHHTAVVEDGARVEGAALGPHVFVGARARIAAGSQVHAGVIIGHDAQIGADCVLWPNVVIGARVSLGARVIVHSNSSIGADGFGYLQRGGRHVKIPQIGTVVIEDDVEIGSNSCVDRARSGVTRIRRGTKIDNLVQIAHNCDIGEDCVIVGQCGISGSTILGRNVVLAGQVGIVDHITIGAGALITAQSGVTKNVPAGAVWRGTPAVPQNQYFDQMYAVRRVARLQKQLREVLQRIERLESAADDQRAG